MHSENDPMTLIQRHHQPTTMCEHLMFHLVSDISDIIGAISSSTGAGRDVVITWTDDDDEIIVQVSYYGVFLCDLPKMQTYLLAGLCYLNAIPLYTDSDLDDMLERELADTATRN